MERPRNILESKEYIEPHCFENDSEAVLFYAYIEQEKYIDFLIDKENQICKLLFDIESQATRLKRASDLKRYLITDLEIIADKALKGQNHIKSPEYYDFNYLTIKQVARRYGEVLICEWLSPYGNDWLKKEKIVDGNFLKEMEKGTIKNCLIKK